MTLKCLLCCCLPLLATASDSVDLLLRGGLHLEGLLSHADGLTVQLQVPWARDPLTLSFDEIHRLQRRRTSAGTPGPPHRLTLINGDQLAGTLVGAAADRIRLQTPWGQEVQIQTRHLRDIESPPAPPRLLADGVGMLPEVTTAPMPDLLANDGILLLGEEVYIVHPSQRTLSLRLPPVESDFQLRFRMEIEEPQVFFTLLWLASHDQTRFTDAAVNSRLHNNQLTTQSGGNTPFQQRLVTEIPRQNPHQFSISARVQMNPALLTMNWNGEELQPLPLSDAALDHLKEGAWLVFQFNRGSRIRLYDLQIWGGRHGLQPQHPPPPRGHVRLEFANGDFFNARIQGFEDGQLQVRLEGIDREIAVPLTALRRIAYPPQRYRRPANSPPGYLLQLGAARSTLTPDTVLWRQDTLVATLPLISPALEIPFAEVDAFQHRAPLPQ